jgi:hypothetical protein
VHRVVFLSIVEFLFDSLTNLDFVFRREGRSKGGNTAPAVGSFFFGPYPLSILGARQYCDPTQSEARKKKDSGKSTAKETMTLLSHSSNYANQQKKLQRNNS